MSPPESAAPSGVLTAAADSWHAAALLPRRGVLLPRQPARLLSAGLALLMQLAFLALWITQLNHGAPRPRAGAAGSGTAAIWYLPPPLHPEAIHPKAAPTPKAQLARPSAPAPRPPVLVLDAAPFTPPPLPPEPVTAPAPVDPPPMSAHDAEEFRRQWAQLQGDLQQQALDRAEHHDLKVELKDWVNSQQKFAAPPSGPVDGDRKATAPRRRRGDDNAMFAGELCVSRAGPEGEMMIALPCIGEAYSTDYGWQDRVHAPARGNPMPAAVDPGGRVTVRKHEFAPETVASLAQAQAELYRIQVTMRLVYLPELRLPIQLLSRDDRVGAISTQAFVDEGELVRYLREWAGNVHRWSGVGAAVPPVGVGTGTK